MTTRRQSLPTLVLLLALFAGTLPAEPATPPAAGPTQYDVEAVYLFDFAKFVRWPAVTFDDGAIDLCIAGSARGLTSALERTVAGEKVGDYPLKVRTVDKVGDEADCNQLFIDAQFKAAPALMEAVARKPILTVSDAPGFLEHGGMVQLETQDGRVRFSVNLTPVSVSGLSLNSELLKVAVKVTGRMGGEQ